MGSKLIFGQRLSTMSEYYLSIRPLGQHMNHLIAPDPVIMVSS